MAPTKRTQNKCKRCSYTWYPRGKNMSLKCPSCGSNEVGYAGGGAALVALLIVGIMIFGGDKKSNSPAHQESNMTVSSAEKMKHVTTKIGENLSPPGESGERNSFSVSIDASTASTSNSLNSSIRAAISSQGNKEDIECSESDAHPEGKRPGKCGNKDSVRNDLY